MKTLLDSYAGYNVWANKQLLDVAEKFTIEQYNEPIISSFPGIAATVLHIWDAEAIWWQRIKLKEHIEIPSQIFTGTLQELSRNFQQQSIAWKEWVQQSVQAALLHEFSYMNSKKERFKQPVYEVLMHLFNHQTYHRGQLVTIFRQLGCTKIPSTDLITYYRKK
jgi:uncharacterized damage-inducible protein DinB